MTAATRFVY